jgi:cell division transport system ATP-binding protein
MFHATKRYDQQYVALNDITLNIPKGQFAFLTGPSGAGKSTLLRLLIREEIATSGQIIVNGRNIAIIPDHKFQSAPQYRIRISRFQIIETKRFMKMSRLFCT